MYIFNPYFSFWRKYVGSMLAYEILLKYIESLRNRYAIIWETPQMH